MAVRETLVNDRCVLLVDDVTTSRGTLFEAARVLRDAWAAECTRSRSVMRRAKNLSGRLRAEAT